jgi:hypothetical protein
MGERRAERDQVVLRGRLNIPELAPMATPKGTRDQEEPEQGALEGFDQGRSVTWSGV